MTTSMDQLMFFELSYSEIHHINIPYHFILFRFEERFIE